MNEMTPRKLDSEYRGEDRMAAILWCLDKRHAHVMRFLAALGVIVALKVLKLGLGESPLLPFKVSAGQTGLLIGMLGVVCAYSALAQAYCAEKIKKLVALAPDPVTKIITGEPRDGPKGWERVPFGFGMLLTIASMFAVATLFNQETAAVLSKVYAAMRP